MSLSGYDAWKLATPPEYERRDTCPSCGDQEQFKGDWCGACDWTSDDEDDAYDRYIDQKIDEARGK